MVMLSINVAKCEVIGVLDLNPFGLAVAIANILQPLNPHTRDFKCDAAGGAGHEDAGRPTDHAFQTQVSPVYIEVLSLVGECLTHPKLVANLAVWAFCFCGVANFDAWWRLHAPSPPRLRLAAIKQSANHRGAE